MDAQPAEVEAGGESAGGDEAWLASQVRAEGDQWFSDHFEDCKVKLGQLNIGKNGQIPIFQQLKCFNKLCSEIESPRERRLLNIYLKKNSIILIGMWWRTMRIRGGPRGIDKNVYSCKTNDRKIRNHLSKRKSPGGWKTQGI
jgi:hypothetical protein